MKALVYEGPGKLAFVDKPKPLIKTPTDAIVKIAKTTICGTDLHILKGDVPTVTDGRILGHEGVGIIEQVGGSVSSFQRWRPRADFMHFFVREVHQLQERNVLALREWRWLGPGQPH